ncbi:unnamed protein product, partial [marine sediment metagenome]
FNPSSWSLVDFWHTNITFAIPQGAMRQGVHYALAIWQTTLNQGGVSDDLNWGKNDGDNPYWGGQAFRKIGTGEWVRFFGWDFLFRMNGYPCNSCIQQGMNMDWYIHSEDACNIAGNDIGTGKIIGVKDATGTGCVIGNGGIVKCGGLDLNDDFEFKMGNDSQLQLRD